MAVKRQRQITLPKEEPARGLQPRWYNVEEVAEYFRVAPRTVLRWLQIKRLKGRKFGQAWKIAIEDIRRFEQEQGAQGDE